MCGIVGYIGPRESSAILIDGLRRLEYRGYDSAGIAVLSGGTTQLRRAEGKLARLSALLEADPAHGSPGIGHTRWATHGPPSRENAHPHTVGPISVVHNGIIENYKDLRDELRDQGRSFGSATDTEIIAHLIQRELRAGEQGLEASVRAALRHIRGTYALAVMSADEPELLVVAKNASPLVIGLGDGETFVASDIPAILPYSRDVIFLEEGEVAVVRASGPTISTLSGKAVERASRRIAWTSVQAERGGYKHFMLKEIFEQPRAVTDTLLGRLLPEDDRVQLDKASIEPEQLAKIRRIYILACGTSWHAGLVGRLMIERFARIPTEVDLAHEFRYREPVVGEDTLVIGISQSGETADTLAAVKMARAAGAKVLTLCNVVESSLARASDFVLYTHAGPEISVASTKAFTSQLSALALVAIYLGQQSGHLDPKRRHELIEQLLSLPEAMAETLKHLDAPVRNLARAFAGARNFLFLGRGFNFPIALEGALKLKEISYIHAEGYAAGEMKHGPIALIDEHMPVVVLAPRGSHYDKIVGNLEEAKARQGRIIAVATVGDKRIADIADHILQVPDVGSSFQPLVTVLPLQLFAYHVADLLGTDVDQPRNLAKAVTVE